MEQIIIIGGGGHAKVLISIIKKNNQYSILGYVDSENNGDILGVKYIGNDDILDELLIKGITFAAIGIGQVNLTNKRFEIANKLKKLGFTLPQIISKDAIVNEEVILGEGTQVLDGAVINPGSKIGEFTIINTNSVVEHDCIIGNYCHIATNATLSGGVELGDFSMVGANAVIVQYKKIVSYVMIGAGAVVNKDIFESGTYKGVPMKKTDI